MKKIVMVACLFTMVVWALASIAPSAWATPILGSSIAQVTAVSGSLFGGVNVNDLMTFDFSFDPLSATDTKPSTNIGQYGNTDGTFSVDIAGGSFAQVFDDLTPAKLSLKSTPDGDVYKLVAKEGTLMLVWRLEGDGLITSDSLDQIPDLTLLTGASGFIGEMEPGGVIHSELRFTINQPSIGIQYGGPDARPVPEPSALILLGSGFLVFFGLARRKLKKR